MSNLGKYIGRTVLYKGTGTHGKNYPGVVIEVNEDAETVDIHTYGPYGGYQTAVKRGDGPGEWQPVKQSRLRPGEVRRIAKKAAAIIFDDLEKRAALAASATDLKDGARQLGEGSAENQANSGSTQNG